MAGPTLDDLWHAYIRARLRAEQSTDIADGIAAGKARGRFLDAYVEHEERDSLHVIQGGRQ